MIQLISSLNEDLFGLYLFDRVINDPAVVVRGDIIPSGFKLVSDGPHELTFDVAVEVVHDTLAELLDVFVREEV